MCIALVAQLVQVLLELRSHSARLKSVDFCEAWRNSRASKFQFLRCQHLCHLCHKHRRNQSKQDHLQIRSGATLRSEDTRLSVNMRPNNRTHQKCHMRIEVHRLQVDQCRAELKVVELGR